MMELEAQQPQHMRKNKALSSRYGAPLSATEKAELDIIDEIMNDSENSTQEFEKVMKNAHNLLAQMRALLAKAT